MFFTPNNTQKIFTFSYLSNNILQFTLLHDTNKGLRRICMENECRSDWSEALYVCKSKFPWAKCSLNYIVQLTTSLSYNEVARTAIVQGVTLVLLLINISKINLTIKIIKTFLINFFYIKFWIIIYKKHLTITTSFLSPLLEEGGKKSKIYI